MANGSGSGLGRAGKRGKWHHWKCSALARVSCRSFALYFQIRLYNPKE